ncbi:hypothetical protein BIWAKO_01057 [Bosea sp. BIWAKO-01]|nr:hypothetical protein BIWAKO_01057 [Bosea sp. BIWAKO-01]
MRRERNPRPVSNKRNLSASFRKLIAALTDLHMHLTCFGTKVASRVG